SLLTMELVVKIEELFGVDLPLIDVIELPQLAGLASRIDEAADGGVAGSLLRPYRVHGGSQRVVLVPGAVGMAVGLFRIADVIDADIDVYLFDYPGHRAGEAPESSIGAITERLLVEIERAGISSDVALYGNSLGSWV